MNRPLFIVGLLFALTHSPAVAQQDAPAPPGVLGDVSWRHAGTVHCLHFSADGQMLVSSASDRTIRIWDVATGQVYRRFIGHDRPVTSLGFSADGRMLISAGHQSVRLCEVSSGQERARVGGRFTWSGPVAISPDGRVAAHRHGDGLDTRVRLSAVPSGKLLRDLQGHTGPVLALAFSPNGKVLATASQDGTIRLWDVAGGKQTRRWPAGNSSGANTLVFSPDGKHLASASRTHGVCVWTVQGEKAGSTSASPGLGQTLAFSPTATTLALGESGWLRLWDWQSGKTTRRWRAADVSIHAVAFSPDGKLLAAGQLQGPIRLWDAATGEEKSRSSGGHDQGVTGLSYSSDGKTLASFSPDHTIRFWDVAGRKELRSIRGLFNRGEAVAFSPDGRLAASLHMDRRAAVWRTDTAQLAWAIDLTGPTSRPWGLAFTPDGKHLAVSRQDGVVQLYDAATHEKGRTFLGPRGSATSLVFSPDGRYLAGYVNPSLYLWDTTAKAGQARVLNTRHPILSRLSFSPDSRLLAAVGASGSSVVQLIETATGQLRQTLSPHRNGILAAAFSPDGRLLATGGVDRTFCFYEVGTGSLLRRVAHPGAVTALAWRPDGQELASGGEDTLIRLWVPAGLLPTRRPTAAKKRTDAEVEMLWTDLGGEQASKAGAAMRLLAQGPDQAVDLFRLRAVLFAPAQLQQWLAELDSDDFKTREGAAARLAKLGAAVAEPLRTALEGKLSFEARKRIQGLLRKIEGRGTPAKGAANSALHVNRIVELVERLGTPAAYKLLQEWANSKSQKELTRLAKEALARQERIRKTRP